MDQAQEALQDAQAAKTTADKDQVPAYTNCCSAVCCACLACPSVPICLPAAIRLASVALLSPGVVQMMTPPPLDSPGLADSRTLQGSPIKLSSSITGLDTQATICVLRGCQLPTMCMCPDLLCSKCTRISREELSSPPHSCASGDHWLCLLVLPSCVPLRWPLSHAGKLTPREQASLQDEMGAFKLQVPNVGHVHVWRDVRRARRLIGRFSAY